MYKTAFVYILFFWCHWTVAQYTETINSNKPGESMGAFSVGQHVFQVEVDNQTEFMKHASFNDSKVIANATDITLRYGLYRDELELMWDFTYQFDQLQSRVGFPVNINRNGVYRNSIGAKYLFFDPDKYSKKRQKKEEDRIDVRSWNANNGFQWRKLIPAVSVYAGFNVNFGDTFAYGNYFADFQVVGLPDSSDEPTFSPRLSLQTQSHPHEDWVLVTNLSYNRIGTDFPELGFIATVTYNLPNPRWSVYVESQTFDSDVYADQIFRGGAAYLLRRNLQLDATIGGNIKNTPSRIFGNIGLSFRIDNHTEDDAMSFERYQRKLGREVVQEETAKRNAIKKERKEERKEKKRRKRDRDRDAEALDAFDEDAPNGEARGSSQEDLEEDTDERGGRVRNDFREMIEEDDGDWRARANDEVKEQMELEQEEKDLKKAEKEQRKEEKRKRKEEKQRLKDEKKAEKKKNKKKKKRDQKAEDDFNEAR